MEYFWDYVDEQAGGCGPMIGNAELFASFRQPDEVSVDGVAEPTAMALDSRRGDAWRYRILCEYWKDGQLWFPDDSLT